MAHDRIICNDLMDHASSGDDGAFGQLALMVQDDVYRFGLAHGLRADDAAEITQETFLRAFRIRRNWRAGGDAVGWLYGIVMNVVREFHRRNYRRPVEGLELDNMVGSECGGASDVWQSPDAAMGRAADSESLAEALAKLPSRQREAVSCRFLLTMSLKETADIMGCAEGTVKAAVFAGLENLRKLITKR